MIINKLSICMEGRIKEAANMTGMAKGKVLLLRREKRYSEASGRVQNKEEK